MAVIVITFSRPRATGESETGQPIFSHTSDSEERSLERMNHSETRYSSVRLSYLSPENVPAQSERKMIRLFRRWWKRSTGDADLELIVPE